MSAPQENFSARKSWMSLLAKSAPEQLEQLFERLGTPPEFDWMRPPETGGVMVRGRAGGTGAPFNLGEMTVTRCALRIDTGETGHAYVQGRDKDHARRAALIDALMQTNRASELRASVLNPLAGCLDTAKATRAAKAGATKVDFFTMVRGED